MAAKGDALMRIRPVVKGLLTFVPGMQKVLPKKGTDGTNSAVYCYGVWLKHLTLLWENGMRSIPITIAELGPGDSLGTGLAAMLSGANNYLALDVVKYSDITLNLKIFDELVSSFKTRTGRPTKNWPDYDNYLDDNLFPSHILTDEVLDASLTEERILLIRKALMIPESKNTGITIKYMVPWSDDNIIEKESIDLIISQAVLEHVMDLDSTYRALHSWLRPGGYMSHQIDFTSHGLSDKWNGHWASSEKLWNVMLGRRPYFINRQPCSAHVGLTKKHGFKLICHLKRHRTDGVQRSQLSSYWKEISDDDLTCSATFIQAQKQ